MTGRRRGIYLLIAVAAFLTVVSTAGAAPQQDESSNRFQALSGGAASEFALPDDVELVRRLVVHGLTYERYQQVFGDARAKVLGGELALYRDSSGISVAVLGTHYSDILPTNSINLTAAEARQVTERDLGPNGARTVDLLTNPVSGRYFFRVETRRFDERWIHWIDASNGRVLRKFDNLQQDHGAGVKGDTKDLNGPNNAATGDDLTTFHNAAGHGAAGAHWDLFSNDNRQQTYNAKNGQSFAYFTTDTDNHWTTVTANRKSPGQPAMVDAQYYANLADDYYQAVYGLDWIGDCGYAAMQSVVHYKVNYSNAFWNGTYVVYGDGDGSTDREYSGGLDIVAHEYAHAITDCTSLLIYQDESGALNESFSDIVGNSAEFHANEPNSTNCVLATGQLNCADWWIGEDIDLVSDAVPGFRNMANPAEDGDPDHYTERQIGGVDNGGVHTNSGIPNHAFYLLAEGGSNASGNPGPIVTGIGLADAQQIFFLGFIGLPSNATMCDARAGTEVIASSLFGAGSQEKASTADAWRAVGLTDAQCGVAPNTPPTADSTSAATTQGSPVPVDLTGSDPETCELTFAIVAPPANGSVGSMTDSACTAGSPNTDAASVNYTPNGGFTGSDSFTYKVNDGAADSNIATASLTVNAVAADYASTVLADNPAAYWRLGEGSGTGAVDASGNANTGTYAGGPGLGAPALIADPNASVHFDGSDDQITFPDSTSLSPTTAISIEAWVRPDVVPTAAGSAWQLVSKWNTALLYLQGGASPKFVFTLYDAGSSSYSASVIGTSPIAANTVYHVVGTYDGANMRLYFNGTLQATVARTGPVNNSATGGVLAAAGWGTLPSPRFQGRLDEVAIYGSALSPSQVQGHFDQGSPYRALVLADSPAAYWRLGEASGTGAVDASGNANTGTYAGGPGLGAPALIADPNASVHFDGSDDQITFPDSTSLSPTTAISIEAWVRPDVVPTAAGSAWQLVSKWNTALLYLQGGASPKFVFTLYDAGSSSYSASVIGTSPIAANTVYHVVGTYDGANMRLYFNGTLQATVARTGPVNNSATGGVLAAAGWGTLPSPRFQGRLDEVAIYGSALNASQAQEHYTAGSP